MVSDRLFEESGDIMVLILVVMEDGLRQWDPAIGDYSSGLNPCCNGRWSQT